MKNISTNITSKTEKWNCMTHAAGILFGIVFIPKMLFDAFKFCDDDQFLNIVSYSIFFFCTFLFSTIYHWLPCSQMKECFRKLDQACIHFLIAATYLPLISKYMNIGEGLLLLTLVCIFVPVGIVLIWQYKSKYSSAMVAVYALQGLMYLFFFNSFFENMPLYVMQMILVGSIFIVVGIFFFRQQKWKYNHAIWHLFVLCGNILFFFAIEESL